jgi:hypothetical protein
MTNAFNQLDFCQFGGHDVTTLRTGQHLAPAAFQDNGRISMWLVCMTCSEFLQGIGDSTMFVLSRWARECGDNTTQLPVSVRETPLKQSLLIQYVDEFLNNNIRKKFGDRFPCFLSDLNEIEKRHFIEALEQDSTIANIFLPDVKERTERKSVALKFWVGGTTAAKATRKTHNVAGGEEEYTPEQREADFNAADNYAKKDEIFCAGVEVAPILELIIRKKKEISLERAKRDSPIWKYINGTAHDKHVKQEDLVICNGCLLYDIP